jgi:acyl-CoA synthetase (NDP forming)
MATMDAIKHFGGDPANFLDVGGGATKEQVTAAFQIILKDPNVNAILVNIFGGIMNCNTIAEGVVAAATETKLSLPLVVRLEGNNVEAGRNTLSKSGISLITADSLADAAKKLYLKLQHKHKEFFNISWQFSLIQIPKYLFKASLEASVGDTHSLASNTVRKLLQELLLENPANFLKKKFRFLTASRKPPKNRGQVHQLFSFPHLLPLTQYLKL